MSYLDDDLLKSIQADIDGDKKHFKMEALSQESVSRTRTAELRATVAEDRSAADAPYVASKRSRQRSYDTSKAEEYLDAKLVAAQTAEHSSDTASQPTVESVPASSSQPLAESSPTSASSTTVPLATSSSAKSTAIGSDTQPSKVDKSAYYLYKSTDPQTAERFKPRKIDLDSQMDAPLEALRRDKSKGSVWNVGGATMEQYDYSEWFSERLTLELCKLRFAFGSETVTVVSVSKMDASATFIVTRGKLRPGFDVTFTAKWQLDRVSPMLEEMEEEAKESDDRKKKKMKKKKKKKDTIEGTFSMDDICDCDPMEEWQFAAALTVGSKKPLAIKARAAVIAAKKQIVDVVEAVICEFKAKKQ